MAVIALSVCVPFAFSGCVALLAVGAAGGAAAYYMGSLTTTLPNSVEEVQRAVKQSAKLDLKFVMINLKEDSVCAEYEMRNALDKKIVITLNKTHDGMTKIDIRVGTFGDETVARSILDAIKTRLS